ncbi:phosphate acyltransferase PlsX [Miniphocaeibacter halophilus]|uniref:Phosphate acyltransferase PlsX n=1 Tax=Miniphocaeibacter halophilus TaxID=2931922 RepID=A0AC61MPR1_9FIRM|nr:phosphate acyltransferase PlsX [Miniphocaeibacter halophilus]QQK07542.1 phosphate acyltransferase PlsX [Miniphocaeibacter halophilus]
MKILVDTLGADKGYEEIVKGALKALENHNNLYLTFIGNEEEIKKLVKNNTDKINYIDTNEYIKNDEEPALAIRRNKKSSLHLGLKALNEKEYDGLISCGSTGALLAGATLITKRLQNISRAALTIVFPTEKNPCVLLDAGANMDCPPELLVQFALMGSVYSKGVLNTNNPKVGLLSVGTEEGKGDKLRKDTYELLKNSDLNFQGNVEARDLLSGNSDVIITDGFSGNVLLKSTEGTAITIMGRLKKGILGSFKAKIGALLLKDVLKDVKNMLDYNEYGAAPLLGVKKAVFKAHGSSNARAIETGIDAMVKFVENDIINKIEKELAKKEIEE